MFLFNFHFCVFQVEEKFVERLPIVTHNDTSLYSSQSELNITLTKEHFTEVDHAAVSLHINKLVFYQDARIEISCVASIGSLRSVTNTGSASDAG